MELKEVIFTSILVSFLIVQNYLLYSIPITLTYLFFYLIANKVKNKGLINISVFLFVLVKNILMPALPFTIIFDIIGLLIFVNISYLKPILLRYLLIPIIIIIHILLLDFSTALLMGDIFKGLIVNVTSGFITYLYAPLSIIFILMADGVNFITEYEN